ncbi:MAG TPA: N-methyl-D-aspartate receptor NMDAR2C subunit [Myxococcota bacterium]|nr:N-methyl-D-aspartate receptor NMDAR2C subunit [Myxococcota bacterium]
MSRALEAWHGAWRALRVTPAPGLLARLEACYREPHRAYHTLQHLDECFARLAEAQSLAPHLAEVRIALWFHDAVYETRASDNEEASARWARESLEAARAPAEAAARVAELVLATRHAALPAGPDAQLLVDVDLSILGADEPRFDEYERQVRREYDWVAEDAFRAGRARVLESFLARPAIYATPWFAGRLEQRARANLRRSLRALGA